MRGARRRARLIVALRDARLWHRGMPSSGAHAQVPVAHAPPGGDLESADVLESDLEKENVLENVVKYVHPPHAATGRAGNGSEPTGRPESKGVAVLPPAASSFVADEQGSRRVRIVSVHVGTSDWVPMQASMAAKSNPP